MTSAQLGAALPPEAAAAELRRRGPQKMPTKEMVAIRIDRDVLDVLRGDGKGWQSRVNGILRKPVGL